MGKIFAKQVMDERIISFIKNSYKFFKNLKESHNRNINLHTKEPINLVY